MFTSAPAKHDDVTPADAGLGPYDVPPAPPPRTAWDFAHGDEAWKNTMGFTAVAVRDGALVGSTSNNDPAFFSPTMHADAEKFSSVIVRMKLARTDGTALKDKGQIFWSTSRLPFSEESSVHFEIFGDGQWHDYVVPLAGSRRWRGTITGLRLDPCNQKDVRVEIAHLKLQ